ncbi:MAG: OsmC family protein [Steroidobacteraceae bacterium]
MKARIKLAEGMTFVAESGSGHAMVIDAAPDIGGRNLGPRPMELLLMGLGGCTSIDVMLILRKSREQVTDCVVELDAERAPTDPKVFTSIHMRYVVTGRGLDRNKVERAIKLSAEKYCSATAILSGTAKITHSLDLVEDGASPAAAAAV